VRLVVEYLAFEVAHQGVLLRRVGLMQHRGEPCSYVLLEAIKSAAIPQLSTYRPAAVLLPHRGPDVGPLSPL